MILIYFETILHLKFSQKQFFLTIRKANGGLAQVVNKLEGYTKYDAIRIIENDNGLFIKLNDPTFSRSSLEHGELSSGIFIPFTRVTDCRQQLTTSTANLARTPIKFSASVLPYPSMGSNHSGGAVLSSNNQVMTITNQGRCGTTYFAHYDSDWELQLTDNHPVLGEHLLPVTF